MCMPVVHSNNSDKQMDSIFDVCPMQKLIYHCVSFISSHVRVNTSTLLFLFSCWPVNIYTLMSEYVNIKLVSSYVIHK